MTCGNKSDTERTDTRGPGTRAPEVRATHSTLPSHAPESSRHSLVNKARWSIRKSASRGGVLQGVRRSLSRRRDRASTGHRAGFQTRRQAASGETGWGRSPTESPTESPTIGRPKSHLVTIKEQPRPGGFVSPRQQDQPAAMIRPFWAVRPRLVLPLRGWWFCWF
jgi:hypothetical protein